MVDMTEVGTEGRLLTAVGDGEEVGTEQLWIALSRLSRTPIMTRARRTESVTLRLRRRGAVGKHRSLYGK